MSARVFVPSFANGAFIIFEQIKDEMGSRTYQACLKLDDRAENVLEYLSGTVDPSEVPWCLKIGQKLLEYRARCATIDQFDPLAQCADPDSVSDPLAISLIRMSADFASSVYLYSAAAKEYLAKPIGTRISHELSLQLYRQTLNFYDLERARRFATEDWPNLINRPMSRHYRECFGDVFFLIGNRIGDKRLSFKALQSAVKVTPSLDRIQSLRNLAAILQESEVVIRQAKMQESFEPLTDLALAQVIVAYARLGQMDDANAHLAKLRELGSPVAQARAEKVEKFLAGLRS